MKQSFRRSNTVLKSGVQRQINFVLMMWPFSMLLVLSFIVDSEIQNDYLNWCLIWERLKNVAHKFPLSLPHSNTMGFSRRDGHQRITLLSSECCSTSEIKKDQENAAKSICFMWLPTSATQESLHLFCLASWCFCIFSSYVRSESEVWT